MIPVKVSILTHTSDNNVKTIYEAVDLHYEIEKLSNLYSKILPLKKCIPEETANVEISLTIATPEAIQAINNKYRDVDKPTDVLSFPMWENDDGNFEPARQWETLPLGDIVICPDFILANAKNNNKTFRQELVLIVSHGLLHLIGRDHNTAERKKNMWEEQELIVKQYFADTIENIM